VLWEWVVLATMLLDTNYCNYFLWGYLKDCVYHTNPQELQTEAEVAAEEITGDMVDNFVVCIQCS
jgi:hypothetical protein